MTRRTRRLSLTALGSGCAAIMISGVAGVASGPPPTTTSTTEAGYTAAVSGSALVLKGQITVPTLACTSTQAGISPGEYLTTSTSTTGGAVFLACSGGSAVYEAVATINNTRSVLSGITVTPGDDMWIVVTVSPTATTVVVRDATKATKQKVSGAGSAPTQLFVGEAAVHASGGSLLAVPSFGMLRFRTTTLNQVDFGSTGPSAVNMVNSASVVQITTGKLSATGAAFITTFDHS